MKDFIKGELRKLNVINDEYVDEYVEFCLNNNVKKEKFKTALHHILPKALNLPFGEFSDLRKNKWNSVTLTHKDHYKAHYLLTLAFNEPSILCAFCAMNEKDLKNKRLNSNDLIGADEYDLIIKRRNRELSELKLSNDWKESTGKDAIRKMKENFDYGQVAKKRLETITSPEWRNGVGKNMWLGIASKIDYVKTGKKQSETKSSTEWKEIVGKNAIEKRLEKMNYEMVGKKQSETKSSTEWKEIVGKNAIEKLSKSRRKMFPKYNVYNNNNELVYENIDQVDLRKISFVLERKTKDERMGSTRQSKIELNKKQKLHLVGWYTEKITMENKNG